MVVGELPFQSPYYDHKRRGRILKLSLRGLTPKHSEAMVHLTPGNL